MPVDVPKPAPKGGKGVKGKIGGIPIPVIAIGVLLAIGIGLYIRHKSGTSAATQSAATPASGTDTTGGAGSAAATPQDLSPVSDLAASINGLSGILGAGGFGGIGSGAGANSATVAAAGTDTTQPWLSSSNPGTIFTDAGTGQTFAVGPSGQPMPAYIGPAGDYVSPLTYTGAGVAPSAISAGGKPLTSAPTQVKPAALPAAPRGAATNVKPAPFGGIVSTKKNQKTGVTTTTYASGRIVEKAPGKTPYVAKK